jgi:hypothetical protein
MSDWSFFLSILGACVAVASVGVGLLGWVRSGLNARSSAGREQVLDRQKILETAGFVVTMADAIRRELPDAKRLVRRHAEAAGQPGGSITKRASAAFDQIAGDATDVSRRGAEILSSPGLLKKLNSQSLAELMAGLSSDRTRMAALRAEFDRRVADQHASLEVLRSTPKPKGAI